MKGIKGRIIILSALFILIIVLAMAGGREAGAVQNRGSAYQAASLPVMCFSWEGKRINPLYGAVDVQEKGAEKPSVYPFLSDDLKMEVHLMDGREKPAEITYELRDERDARLVAQGKIDSWTEERGDLRFPLEFEDILTPDRYYILNFKLLFSKGSVSYGTRVMKLSEKDTITMLSQYAQNLHEDLFQRDKARAYASHLETDTYSDKDTLATVSLNSSFDQFSWGSGEVSRKGDSWMTIEGIQGNYLYLDFSYLAQAPMNSELTADFRVSEYISLQRYGMAIYLLNYERHTEQLWRFESNSVVTEGFLLGVQEKENLHGRISRNERFYCFSVNGELYLYDVSEVRLTKIFSFRQEGEHPLRTLKRDYDVKIMEVSDEGQVEFAVFGYMNGGSREGCSGISYCRYQAEENQVREQMFLHSHQAPATLMGEVERIFTKGQDNFLYFILDEELLVMDIDTGETAVLVSRSEYPGLQVSESGNIFAWSSETDQQKPRTLRVINLKSGNRSTMEAENGQFIKPIGFLREDMVLAYGALEGEFLSDGLQPRISYESIEIMNESLESLYHYQMPDIRIDRVEVKEDKMELHRFVYTQGEYGYLSPDVMLRSDQPEGKPEHFGSYKHENLKKMAVMRCPRLPSSLRIEQNATRLFSEGRQLNPPRSEQPASFFNRFYAYGKNGLTGVSGNLGQAIRLAGEAYGFVLSRDGEVIWKWVGRQEEIQLEVGENIMRPGDKWEEVSGLSLRELMSFLHDGKPVRWVSPDQGSIWLIGYEWKNVILYNPQNASLFRMLQTDFEEFIARDNNYLWISALTGG